MKIEIEIKYDVGDIINVDGKEHLIGAIMVRVNQLQGSDKYELIDYCIDEHDENGILITFQELKLPDNTFLVSASEISTLPRLRAECVGLDNPSVE